MVNNWPPWLNRMDRPSGDQFGASKTASAVWITRTRWVEMS
jgi:hypothetical protein